MFMKKALRYLLIILGIVVVLVAGAAGFVALRGIPSFKADRVDLKVEVTPERIDRGQKLATLLCKSCHLDPNTNKLTGKKLDDVPMFGEIYSRNITQHPDYGIGKWTDGEIAYLLRTGIKPDGTYLPLMVQLKHMSDEDIYSVIAYLRSDHVWVTPDNTRQSDTKYSFLAKALANVGFLLKPGVYPKQAIPDPDTSNKVSWGKYLTLQLDCYTCHSADIFKLNLEHPEKTPGFFGGGTTLKTPDGEDIVSRNITMDEETGIGKWTEDEFIKAIKYGQTPGGPALRAPMPPFSALTDNEAKAIHAYLKTVPKIKNKIER
jgi:mono/diheme cytochrome c family protein